MTEPSPQFDLIPVADAGAVLAAAADALVARTRNRLPDLAHALVLLPNLHAAGEFRQRLLQSSVCSSLILPRNSTYARLAGDGGEFELHGAARTVWLCGAMRARNWFDDASRWGVCRELAGLFDELTERNIALPQDLAQFREQVRQAYGSGVLRGIDFEARLISELWFALEASGAASPAARRKLSLARLAATPAGPLVAVLFEPMLPEQQAFFSAWAQSQPVAVIAFAPEAAPTDSLTGFLHAVWPGSPAVAGANAPAIVPLAERAARLHRDNAVSPLAGRVSLFGAGSAEQEARAAVLSIRGWLRGGAQSVAVVAQDRLVARRLRALLERERILVSDEAGWKLSTTSAATAVARWLDTVADGFHHRDLLDLLKSPFALSDVETDVRREQVHRLEQIMRRENIAEGLDAIAAAAVRDEAAPGAEGGLRALVERLQRAARAQLPRSRETGTAGAGVPLGAWLNRLDEALRILGIAEGLAGDAAGSQLLELLRAQSEALADDRQPFAFHEWRGWLNGEFESATFLDATIESPVMFTQLAATRLRRFDKVLVLGADAAHLPGSTVAGRFFNQRARASLGLSTSDAASEALRRDLIALIALAGEVRFSWQAQRNGEPNAPAPLVDLLCAVHRHGFGDALAAAELAAWLREGAGDAGFDAAAGADFPQRPPRPSAAVLVPQRISVSAYASLVACPYQFYARHMLRLNEADEVEEQVAKRDFGDAVHRILNTFHRQVPQVTKLPADECLQLLERLGEREFAPLLARNPLAAGYRAEWKAMLLHYLDWQLAREAEGWRFHSAELRREHTLPLSDGAQLVLTGRLDRIDVNATGGYAVLDYKTRRAELLRQDVAAPDEDVQLASYALLLDIGGSGPPVQAGYIALERQRVTPVTYAGDTADMAARTALRLDAAFTAMRAGAPLPAQGAAAVCGYCEMRGLCRRDYWERE